MNQIRSAPVQHVVECARVSRDHVVFAVGGEVHEGVSQATWISRVPIEGVRRGGEGRDRGGRPAKAGQRQSMNKQRPQPNLTPAAPMVRAIRDLRAFVSG